MPLLLKLKNLIDNQIAEYKQREILKAIQNRACLNCIGLKCNGKDCQAWNIES
jgi:hypothetical protein